MHVDTVVVLTPHAPDALQGFVSDQHLAMRAVQPIVKDLVQTLLTLLQEAESDDLACVLGKLCVVVLCVQMLVLGSLIL